MRETINFNHGWQVLVNPPAPAIPTSAEAMYLSAKTQRLRWGAGAFRHIDVDCKDFTGEVSAENWESVDLPHDYIISQVPDKTQARSLGYFKYAPAWYRKHFTLAPDDEGKHITVFFEGITGISDIYLNGCFLKHNNGGYASFEVDISDLARFDQENVLAVHVDPASYETWWYEGGGIYRNVWLCKTDTVAIARWGIFLPVRRTSETQWEIPVQLEVQNTDYEDAFVRAIAEIYSPDGAKVTECTLSGVAAPRNVTVLTNGTAIENPQLWDVDSPVLYMAKVTLERKANGGYETCDTMDQRFGFRTCAWSATEGFFLNGRHLMLKGVCAHLDYGLTGKAVSDNVCRYKMKLIKDMGANALRTSHYPHQQATMDACDEMGLLVMDETRRFESCDDASEQMRMLVRRDRNHPSVFIWSTGNEEVEYHRISQGKHIHKALEYIAKTEDGTRPVTCAVSAAGTTNIQDVLEVLGTNYSLADVDAIHEKYPDKPFFASECCAVGSTRGWYYGDCPESGRLDARDRALGDDCYGFAGRERNWKLIMARPWHAGEFQWDAFEHRGEAIWPRLCSVSGAYDLFLQRKDAFYQNQSLWMEAPMIHLLPHWNHPGLDGMDINVWAYTNCQEAELFLNGESLGRKQVAKWTHLEWTVPYKPGKIEVRGYIDGKLAATDAHETTGAATALSLKLENGPVFANGEDVAVFSCTALDSCGREVPDASPMVYFECPQGGRIVGTGSDNTDHSPVPTPHRKMYAGRIAIAVKLNALPKDETHGKIILLARADGLLGACLQFNVTQN